MIDSLLERGTVARFLVTEMNSDLLGCSNFHESALTKHYIDSVADF
jgi:hypothetical protein